MKGLILHIIQIFYYKLSRLCFVILHGIAAPQLKIKFGVINRCHFEGKNRIGRNCKFISDSATQTRFSMGKYSWLRDNVEINLPAATNIILGQNVSIQDNVTLIGDISVGDGCIFAPSIFASSGSHYAFNFPHLSIREQDRMVLSKAFVSEPIRIDEDCWIGYNVVIVKGSHISRGCVVGSGARVSGYIPPYSVIVGNNVELKKRLHFQPPSSISSDEKDLPYFYEGFYSKNALKQKYRTFSKIGVIILKEGTYRRLVISGNSNKSNLKIVLNDKILSNGEILTNQLGYNLDTDLGISNLPEYLKDLLPNNILRIIASEDNQISISNVSLI